MQKYAQVENGVVTNIAKAEPDFAEAQGWVEAPPKAGKGWLHDGKRFAPPPPEPKTKQDVEREKGRRIAAGFEWRGHSFQSDPDSLQSIMHAMTAATAYIAQGGNPKNAFWFVPDKPFAWIAADNSEVQLSPAMMIELGNAALSHKRSMTFWARALKAMPELPRGVALTDKRTSGGKK